jgi:hypothetical protein
VAKEVDEIWDEALKEIAANHQVGKNHQFLCEEAIGNIAALKTINDTTAEEMLKNS